MANTQRRPKRFRNLYRNFANAVLTGLDKGFDILKFTLFICTVVCAIFFPPAFLVSGMSFLSVWFVGFLYKDMRGEQAPATASANEAPATSKNPEASNAKKNEKTAGLNPDLDNSNTIKNNETTAGNEKTPTPEDTASIIANLNGLVDALSKRVEDTFANVETLKDLCIKNGIISDGSSEQNQEQLDNPALVPPPNKALPPNNNPTAKQ